jgi:hypothetical protein
MKALPSRSFLIAVLALTIASCTSAESPVTGVDPVTGTISVGITSPGSNDFVVTVFVNGPGGFRTAPMRLAGTLAFSDLEPGAYTVGTTILGFDCQSVSANVQGNQTTSANIACTRRTATATGIVTGMVTGGDSPLSGAAVELSAHGVVLTRRTSVNGHLSFVGVPGGEYALTASHQHFTCPVQPIHVNPDQVTTANISCTPKPTGAITGIVSPVDLESAHVQLNGPASRTTTAAPLRDSFAFDELPPGTYTVTATASGVNCDAVSAVVQAAQTTTVAITCTSPTPPEPSSPFASELVGGWAYNRTSVGQTGTCQGVLSGTVSEFSGFMTFGASNSSIQIVGLDPDLALVGLYEAGVFNGSGTTARGDGSTIQVDVTLSFYLDRWYDGGLWFSTMMWTRRHRDPGGNLVCTEVYDAIGYRVG